ncbi:MAG: hypothetical protein K0R67_3843, partial [Paenibacillus sp.]|nr:hypothetical protein [Paenibacillus sp.]
MLDIHLGKTVGSECTKLFTQLPGVDFGS